MSTHNVLVRCSDQVLRSATFCAKPHGLELRRVEGNVSELMFCVPMARVVFAARALPDETSAAESLLVEFHAAPEGGAENAVGSEAVTWVAEPNRLRIFAAAELPVEQPDAISTLYDAVKAAMLLADPDEAFDDAEEGEMVDECNDPA